MMSGAAVVWLIILALLVGYLIGVLVEDRRWRVLETNATKARRARQVTDETP
jgi:hypothetical protein